MSESGKQETTKTVDAIINELGKSPNFLMLLVASCAMSCSYVGVLCAYMVQFTGFIPTAEYTCISQKCLDLRTSFTSESGKREFYLDLWICL